MSDGGRERPSLGAEVSRSSQNWSVRRSAVRSIAWLGVIMYWAGNAAPDEVLHLIWSRGLQSSLLHRRIPIFKGFAHPVRIRHPHGAYMLNPEFYLPR